MSTRDADQKAEMPELDLWGSGRNPPEHRMMSASKTANTTDKKPATGGATMEAIVARENMLLALRAVERNAGAPGVDGITTGRLISVGFAEAKAWCCACNGRGPWWNAGAPHMNAAYPAGAFRRMGLISILETVEAHA